MTNLMTPTGFTLPLVGEDHPLRKRFGRTFVWSATIAMMIHVVVAGGQMAALRRLEGQVPPHDPIVYRITPTPPPSIMIDDVRPPVLLPKLERHDYIPVPVPDFDALEFTGPSSDEIAGQDNPFSTLTGDGDSIVVSYEEVPPSPEEYIAVEEMPRLINGAEVQRATAELYPDVAKSAGVEGMVNLKVYIGKTGNVEQVIVLQGPPMLCDAAKEAVKYAKFTPALQQHRPVGVWVAWSLEFSLRP